MSLGTGNISGNINKFGKNVDDMISPTIKRVQRAGKYFADKDILTKPTCDTLKYILVFTNWILFFVLMALLVGIFYSWPSGMMLFLTLVAGVLITYTVFVNTRWPDMIECARIKMLKEDQAMKKIN